MKKILFVLLFCSILAVPIISVKAFDFKGRESVFIDSSETISDNFVAWADDLELKGVFEKDIMVAGNVVNIDADVKGDVLAVGGEIHINGKVAGNIRALGSNIVIGAEVGRNVTVLGGSVEIAEGANVGWSVLSGSRLLTSNGSIQGDLHSGSKDVSINGLVGGNVYALLGSSGLVEIGEKADIGGNLDYVSSKKAVIKEGASIKGENRQLLEKVHEDDMNRMLSAANMFSKIISLFGLFVIGTVLMILFKKPVLAVIGEMSSRQISSLGWGILFFFAIPLALLLLSATIIALPLVLILGAIFVICLYCAKIFVALLLGIKLIRYVEKKKQIRSLVLPMVIGLIVFMIFVNIPFVGWVINLLGTCWAFGAMLVVSRDIIKGFM